MATTFSLIPLYRAGVKDFTIFWRAPGALVWSNYETGKRIPIGYDVRFTPVLYNDFSLESKRAYYLSEYGEYVDLELTADVSTGAWQFVMPAASVYITATATSSGTAPDIPTTWTNLNRFPSTISYIYPVDTVLNSLISFAGGRLVISDSTKAVLRATLSSNNFARRAYRLVCGYMDDVNTQQVPSIEIYFLEEIGYVITSGGSKVTTARIAISGGSGAGTSSNPLICNGTTVTSYGSSNVPYSTGMLIGEVKQLGPYGTSYRFFSFPALYSQELEPTNSIRYILEPENSGIVSGPETFISTSFNFTYRIKTAYEFTRIRAFAVSEPTGTPPIPREESLVTSESYDGDTRTYTFTVTGIPDWATSVRCVIETIMTEDTQDQGGTNEASGPIGGDGTFDDTSDKVPLPAIPTGISAADSGLVTLFRPSIAQIKALGDYLWSNLDEFWENLQKIFTNPMDYIIALNIFPVRPLVTSDKAIYIGNWLTDITMPPVENQFYEFDCGTVNIDEYFGGYLDYAPNTTARIMLPFIGDREIAINEIMGHVLHLWYRIDLLSGNCLAVLTIANDVYYQWTGNCAIPVPVTGSDWSRLYSGIAKAGITIAGAAIGGAVGAAAGIGVFAGTGIGSLVTSNSIISDLAQPSHPEGPIRTSGGRLVDYYEDASSGTSKPNRSIPATSVASAIGHNIMQGIPRVQHSGDLSGAISIMGNRTPFIVLEYPNVNLPEDYKHIMGYPSNQFVMLGNIKGYTECRTVLFESTKATDEEIEMIIKALKGGVYL